MATPIFSNTVIGEVFDKFIDRTSPSTPPFDTLTYLESMIYKAIRKYFEERKCLIDKHVAHNICEQCLQDNMIEKDLIGVFVIGK